MYFLKKAWGGYLSTGRLTSAPPPFPTVKDKKMSESKFKTSFVNQMFYFVTTTKKENCLLT